MSTDRIQKILVFSTLDPYNAKRILAQLRSEMKDVYITLMTPSDLQESFTGTSSIDHIHSYHRRRNILVTAVMLLRSLRNERFDLFVILCREISEKEHLRSIIFFSFLTHSRRRVLMDANLAKKDIGLQSRITTTLETLLTPCGITLAKLLTLIVVSLASVLLTFLKPSDLRKNRRKTQIAMILPILPDLSHTFIYREIIAMREQGSEFKIIALEEGGRGVIHPEARALLDNTIFVPKISRIRYLTLYFYFLLKYPLRLTKLLSLYASNNLGGKFLFLDFNKLLNSLHPSSGLAFAWELKKLKVSYMHVYGSTYPATRAIVASFLLAIPFSFSTFVDFDYEYGYKMFHSKVEHATFIVATTQFCVNRILSYTSERFSKKIHVIHLGIDRNYSGAPYDISKPIKSKPQYLIAVGRFVEKKGFDYLVKACALLKSRGCTARCMIIGDGPHKERLRSLISILRVQDLVELVDPIPNDQLISLMQPQNILVAPSVYAKDGERDGIPTVILEAMIRGVPVIASGISGIPEIITHEHNGLLVPERDEHALADAIERLIRDTKLRERIRIKGYEKTLQDFDVRESAQTLWSLIESSARRQNP